MTKTGRGADVSIELVVAVARNGVIGRDGNMPWRLSTDLKRFKSITMGTPIVMGRKTFQSIGKALPGRENIVITRDASFDADGATVLTSVEAALEAARRAAVTSGGNRVCIIGGGEIYRLLLPQADVVHLTHVDADPQGDTVFPALDPLKWVVASEENIPPGEKDSAASRYVVYRRKHSDE